MKKNHIIQAGLLLALSLIFSSCGLLPDKEELREMAEKREERAEKKGKKEKAKNKKESQAEMADGEAEAQEAEDQDMELVGIPANSSKNEGNLVGNLICYGRMAMDGGRLYFRNPFDNNRLYVMAENGMPKLLMEHIYVKDMHAFNGFIYYANTSMGDAAQPGFIDKNLYRYEIATGNVQDLTNLSFSENGSWLSFDTIVGGYCYFSYADGSGNGYHIARVPVGGGAVEELLMIGSDKVKGHPMINIVENRLYYRNADGLHALNLDTREILPAVLGFTCDNYLIYDGFIYYSQKDAGGVGKLRKRNLESGEDRELNTTGGTWAADVQFSIFNGKLYTLSKAADKSYGEIWATDLEGQNAVLVTDRANWFNIVDGKLYYRFEDVNSMEISRREAINYVDLMKKKEFSPQAFFDTASFNQSWVIANNCWYYYESDGRMLKDAWKNFGDSWYYFGSDGAMLTNAWVGNFYVGGDGLMVKNNWIDGRYYVGSDGAYYANGWREINGQQFYFTANGEILRNTTTPDGYRVGADGTWQKLPEAQYFSYLFDNRIQSHQDFMEIVGSSELSSYGLREMPIYFGQFISFQGNQLINHGNYYEVKNIGLTADIQHDTFPGYHSNYYDPVLNRWGRWVRVQSNTDWYEGYEGHRYYYGSVYIRADAQVFQGPGDGSGIVYPIPFGNAVDSYGFAGYILEVDSNGYVTKLRLMQWG